MLCCAVRAVLWCAAQCCAVLCCFCAVLCCAVLCCAVLSSHADCASVTGVTMKSQKEITLKNDLQLRDRQDIYRNFLLYCMSGDTVALPMGSTVVVERDESEFARLSQLGEILGLTQFDVANVHKELAETAYRNQVRRPAACCSLAAAISSHPA